MEYKVRNIIPDLDYTDLLKLKKDLKSGGVELKKIVDAQIKKKEAESQKICVTCHNTINLNDPKVLTLIFGPPDFKKKASFCAKDCLDYFVKSL
jgi:hypothetical protein